MCTGVSGLTRGEQQLIPLGPEGLTNKEIANHFWLSNQTVKNRRCRMKQKIGAGDRPGIIQMCRTQGFLILPRRKSVFPPSAFSPVKSFATLLITPPRRNAV